ncbi:hypothetical protein [Alkalihalobacillus deserti]|uniref:hypothetical protein n=1 Tax=Alkalihalobacillus deserti TaxID=2879466 RepID=UPI001D13E03B|nr:hypothetical protein [Alkalihalobacillus deserti]
MKPHTKGFIVILVAAILGFLTAWFSSGIFNSEFIIYCFSFIFGTYLLISLYYSRKKT